MMRKLVSLFVVAPFLAAALPSAAFAASGKEIFLEKKCNDCHLVKAEGIEKKISKKTGKAKKGPDLSNVGSENDADFFTKWLKKEVKIESHFDKAKKVGHKKKFKGTDEELKTLTDWLAARKTKVTVTPEEEGAGAAEEEEEEEK